ncbi:hypothetical protein [Holospora curviuscula]|uniref:Lipoprotein n=1 Tax=Holospora curviuscula TaxID=1082868 RepID=A0A2S5R7M9_9PROT|nr:hypothetical protein [Holospora curviuscula]PPE03349.1 hypothetical protein HCUR_01210 [Holospora curviuscula]
MKYYLTFFMGMGLLGLQGCRMPDTSEGGSGGVLNSCRVQCERNATNFLEREECLAACEEQGKTIRSIPDRSENFYNGVSVKNPMNQRNSTASRA